MSVVTRGRGRGLALPDEVAAAPFVVEVLNMIRTILSESS